MKWIAISCLAIGACLYLLVMLVDLFNSCKDKEYIWFKILVFSFVILVGLGVFGIAITFTILL